MRYRPTALGWIDPDVSTAPEWDQAQLRRLARRLGYVLAWTSDRTPVPFVDQVRTADVDAVLVPSTLHLDVLTLDQLLRLVDVESACPRETFARYFGGVHGCPA
ncbi:hypothetical protein [Nocardia sp. NPDC004711]